MEKILPYKCRCGGTLKPSQTKVEFYGIDFGIKQCTVCTSCGSEYLNQETLQEIENEVKKRGIFALERKVQVTKSDDSLIIKIPPDIADFLGVHNKSFLRLIPVEKGKMEIEVL